MAKIHGKVGALYWRPKMTAITIAFVDSDPDTITDSGNGFVTAGFKAGDIITVSGSTSNDGNYTIDTGGVAAGTLTLIGGDTLTAEGAGDSVTIITALPGQLVAGFFGWDFTHGFDLVEVTDFVDGAVGYKKYILGLEDWTAEGNGFWLTDDFHDWVGDELMARFFVVYNASPNVTTVYSYSGLALVSGISTGSGVDKAIEENISFQGTGKASVLGTGIAFVDGGGGADTITDTGNGFIAAGFEAGDQITVSGSTSNDGDYTIVSVVAGTITLATGTLTAEGAAASVTISARLKLVTRTTAWPS